MTRCPLHNINAPNLHLLGPRDPHISNDETRADIQAQCEAHAPVITPPHSNIHGRNNSRQHSYTTPMVGRVICRLGTEGYLLASDAAKGLIKDI